jgi:exodeoxyribonuclease VIII
MFDEKTAPGLYPEVPEEEYHAAELPDNSCLSDLLLSPAHCYWNLTHPRPPSPSMQLGTAVHLLVLEPQSFNARYAAAPGCDANTKKGDRCSRTASVCRDGEWFCSQHDQGEGPSSGPEIVDPQFLENVWAMKESLMAHKEIRSMLEGEEWPREMSTVFADPESGFNCKTRIDLMRPDITTLLDLKTVRYGGAKERSFAKSIFQFGYHRQAAFYLHGMNQLAPGLYDEFGWIVVETEPPYACALRQLEGKAIDLGREHVLPLLDKFAECAQQNEWPAYPHTDKRIEFAPWMTSQITDDIMSLEESPF